MNTRELLPGMTIDLRLVKTLQGMIEYDISGADDTPVVLSVHAGLGGCDQGRVMTAWVNPDRYRILCPSRPGYLGTPISSGRTIKEQADLFAHLLDALHINRVAIVSASAGGPPGYMFALRHPDRVWALVAIDSISGFYELPKSAGSIAQFLFLNSLGQKLMKLTEEKRLDLFLKQLFQAEFLYSASQIDKHIRYVLDSPEVLTFTRAFMDTMFPYKPRKIGTDNDFIQYAKLTHLPLDGIQCPCLIIHGTHDADVKFYDGVYAYETIPNACRYWIEEGAHLGFWLSPDGCNAQQAAGDFLATCTEGTSGVEPTAT